MCQASQVRPIPVVNFCCLYLAKVFILFWNKITAFIWGITFSSTVYGIGGTFNQRALCALWGPKSGKTNSLSLEFVSWEEYKGKTCTEVISPNYGYLNNSPPRLIISTEILSILRAIYSVNYFMSLSCFESSFDFIYIVCAKFKKKIQTY